MINSFLSGFSGIKMTSKILTFVFFNFVASVAIGVSLIVIPWSIVSLDGTGVALVSASLATTALLAFISPFAGKLIDSCSRKTFLFSLLLFMGLALFVSGKAIESGLYEGLVLVGYFGFTQLFFMLYYNVRGAFIQERFSKEERNSVNSLMEFETQLATLISSIITVVYLTDGDFTSVLTYCSTALILASIAVLISFSSDQVTKPEPQGKSLKRVSVVVGIIREYKSLVIFGVASNAPFLIVMATNVINPVYFNGVQLSDISIIATIGVVYTISAMIGAAMFPKLTTRFSIVSIVTKALFATFIAAILASLIGGEIAVIVASFVWGASNAMCKVSYNTIIMKEVSSSQIGQYYSVIQSSIYVLRAVISIALLALIESSISINLYVITLIISLIAIVTMNEFRKSKAMFSREV